MSEASEQPKGQVNAAVTRIAAVRKRDTAALVSNGVDSMPEDAFAGSYMSAGRGGATAVIEPHYKPNDLLLVCETNNTLAQCVEAMSVNIDGTGHSIELIEGASENEAEKKMLEDFFNEPYPGKTFVSIRRNMRHDLEAAGNGYLEVARNMADEIMFANYLEANDMRLVRLDDPVIVTKKVRRAGKDTDVTVRSRERRYVQIVNGQKVYFREFGSSRQVHRLTGEWEKKGEKIPFEDRGSEVIHLKVNKEARSPYGTPRWVNQMPSALGSRKAEEFNLEFFDAGGLPPVLVMVQGGYLTTEVKDELKLHLNGAGNKHRAAIVEAISSSGSLDSSGTVQIRVERFGSERQSDAMFQNYDKNCEEHIRTGFRLPPMFIGKAADYNFATAKTAYMVAEAQVFGPERTEFDALINNTIVRALGAKNYVFRSLPVTLTDVEMQLKGLQLIADNQGTDGEEIVSVVNEITGLNVEYVEPPQEEPKPIGNIDPITGLPYDKPVQPLPPDPNGIKSIPAKPKLQAVKGETDLIDLVNKWATIVKLEHAPEHIEPQERAAVTARVLSLKGSQAQTFSRLLASKSLSMSEVDSEGVAELCGCATNLMQ